MRGERTAGDTQIALKRYFGRWVLAGLLLEGALAALIAGTSSPVLTTLLLVPALAVAQVETAPRTSVVAVVGVALAVLGGVWNHFPFSSDQAYRLAIVAGSAALAVIAATLRTRAVVARNRMELLGEIAAIAGARQPLDASLARLADLLVPTVADLCEVLVIEDGEVRRAAVRLDGSSAVDERRLRERPVSERERSLARDDQADAVLRHTPEPAELELRMRSAIYAPVRSAGETLALLVLAVGRSGRGLGGDDLSFARTVASRAGLAIENLRFLTGLHEAEQRMQAIVGALADAVTIRDRSGRIVYANEAALKLLHIDSIETLRDRSGVSMMDEYITTDEHGNELTMDDIPSVRLLRGEQPDPLLIHIVHRERGEERWNMLKATALEGPDGSPDASVMIIEDVSVVKRAELETRFLARSSEILASSLDYEQTLRNVAELAVPEVADWCAVDLIDEHGSPHQIVVAHRDPAKRALAEELRSYQPEEPDRTQGLAVVLEKGEPLLYPDVTTEMLEGAARNEEHLRLLSAVGMRSAVIVPMISGGRVIGAMTLVSAESGRRFSESDQRFAEQIAARAAVAVENARLYTQRSQIAATLQHSLLPDALPQLAGWEMASLYRPASRGGEVEVGGDFYDAFRTENGWLILIGDVTGKGVEVASLTLLVRHGARFIGETLSEPSELLGRIDALLRQQQQMMLCSLLCMRLDGDELTFASAGHPLPLIVTDDGVRSVGRTGPVLGAFPDSEWPTESLRLLPGEVLLLYTDGVTDTIGPEERFGENRLRQTMAECGPLAPDELLDCLDAALSKFQVGSQADDTAALALRLADQPTPASGEPTGRRMQAG